VQNGFDASKFVKHLAHSTNGGGGGTASFASGGTIEPHSIVQLEKIARDLLEKDARKKEAERK
jgi:alanyl-tRNA synthetase